MASGLTLEQSLTNARALLHAASARYPVLLIGPPPVDEDAHNARIAELSRALAAVAAEEAVPCLDVFTPLLQSRDWRQEVRTNDGSHPRANGYREFANLVSRWPAWWFNQDGMR